MHKKNTPFTKIIPVLVYILFPVILIADEHEKLKGGNNFFDFLFSLKYLAVLLISAAGILIFLKNKMNLKTRIILMSVSFLIFGVISSFYPKLFITPSPVCASTKPFLYGFKPQFLATLSVIGLLSVFFSKGFCGTACPVGALQELFYRIPFFKKLKFTVPFKITNSIRIFLFILFLAIAFTAGTSAYFYYNLFDLIHWDFIMPWFDFFLFILFLVIILGASIFIFRPFCYFICPMGLYTWVFEQFAPYKVRLNKEKCNQCNLCVKTSPCNAVDSIVNGKIIRGDCHLCGDCIDLCNQEALYFGFKK